MRRPFFPLLGFACATFALESAELVPVEELGLKIAPGFNLTLYSDHDLANDIYAMTLDSQGRVVVTGHGYIKTLHDTNQDGRADAATLFAPTKSGGMGLAFDGPNLYFMGDDGVWLFHDRDQDGRANGPPMKVLSAKSREHGGHALRKGPDGWWYFIGGNDAEFSPEHATLPSSPVGNPAAGALIRFSPDGAASEIIAHGFRNPYDFDFNFLGDIFTFDSDVESDFFLPWYTPTRIFHVGYGGHHGWQLPGWRRGWDRPDYYSDTVPILATLGRGSPTGVTFYRHTHFPEKYQNGFFALDWTFGKVFFCRMRSDGSSYRAAPEIFLEPIGTQGFAPVDAVVAPDGALFVAIGGRKTRGAVYRISYQSPRSSRRPASIQPEWLELKEILGAPQPLDAWSRAKWEPAARRLGRDAFFAAAANDRFSTAERIRAIEILTELFGGLPAPRAALIARSTSPQIRARVAWSLGRVPAPYFSAVLVPLAQDSHPLVRRCALEAMADQVGEFEPEELLKGLPRSLATSDERVRQAAIRLTSRLPEEVFETLGKELNRGGNQPRLSYALAMLSRNPRLHEYPRSLATTVLETSRDSRLRAHAIRLLMLSFGDWNLHQPSVEVYTAYELTALQEGRDKSTAPLLEERMLAKMREAIRKAFPSGEPALDLESARLLAMLQDDHPDTILDVFQMFQTDSSPTTDFHYLTVLSKLRGYWPDDFAPRIAQVILQLDDKLEGEPQRSKQNWNLRLAEVVAALHARNPELAAEILKNPKFPKAAHLNLVAVLGPENRAAAARAFWFAAQDQPDFPWSPRLIQLFSTIPDSPIRPLLREKWEHYGLRDEIIQQLAKNPEEMDRDKFLTGLESSQVQVVAIAAGALKQLPSSSHPADLGPLVRALNRSLSDPAIRSVRSELISLLEKETGRSFVLTEKETDPAALRKSYEPVFNWLSNAHPELAQSVFGEEDDPAHWAQVLRKVDWTRGDAGRGLRIYQARACQTCHSGPNALGPDLHGAARRFSREDLFSALIFPNRHIAPMYLTTLFELRDGDTQVGVIAFESADGVILQTGANTTVRLAEGAILSRRPANRSLMPSGLLAGLEPAELADLYSYLKSMSAEN